MKVRLARVKWPGKKFQNQIQALLMVGGDEFKAFAPVGTPEAQLLQSLKPNRYLPVIELTNNGKSSYSLVELGEEFQVGWDEKIISNNADLLRKAWEEIERAFEGVRLTPGQKKDMIVTLFISISRDYTR